MPRTVARWLLAGVLLVAGVAHFRLTGEFLGQVPTWLPARTAIVWVSGVAELALGVALLLARGRARARVGLAVAALFVAVFPGNLSQWATGSDSFGLASDTSRAVRLLFQPLLVAWALWCTGAWGALRDRAREGPREGLSPRPPSVPPRCIRGIHTRYPSERGGRGMSVRQALLALLEQGPMYGYQLRSEFELRTGSTWPLNVGQVYTTLTRLERDGLVSAAGADVEGHVVYRVTEEGREEVATWFTTPVARTQPPRDELAIKLALAVTVPGVDVGTVIQQQRGATMRALQDYTRLKRDGRAARPSESADMAWSLVLDSLVFAAEAEVRWLDHCEARLRRAASERTGTAVPSRPAEQESTR